MKLNLVDNWRTAYRWFSTQSMAISAAVALSWGAIPQDLRDRLPETLVAWIVGPLLILGIVGRVVQQPVAKDGEG